MSATAPELNPEEERVHDEGYHGEPGPRPALKPEPRFGAASSGLATRVADLGWLLMRVARAHPKSALLWLGANILAGLGVPAQLWAAKGAVDNLQREIEGANGSAMWWFAAVWVAVLGFELVIEQFEGYFAATAQERGGAAIAAATLDKATRIDLASFEHQGFYDNVSRVLTDAEEKAKDVLAQVVRFGWAVPRLVSWAVVLLVFDWKLLLLALVPMIPGLWGWFFSGTIYWDIYREQTRERRLATWYADLLTDRTAAREIRLFGLAETFIKRWDELYWTTRREIRGRALRIALKQRGLSFLSMGTLMFGFAWYVGASDREIGAGTAVVIVASFMWLFSGLMGLGQPIQALGQASGLATDLRGFLALPEEADDRHGTLTGSPTAGEIRLERVTFTYPGAARPVIDDVSLTIRPGETIALVGENGAGKTTLVKLMLGLYAPDHGRVLLDGVDIATLDPGQLRQRLSGVFQDFVRYPLSAEENVTLGAIADLGRVHKALELAGIHETISRLPDGPDTVLSPDLGGVDLSGGQWQRVAIARAGLRDASVLCLDEPTSALDPLAEVAIYRRFAELSRGRTTLLVSHRLGMARLADRIVVLEHGRVIEQGTHDSLVTKRGAEYGRMWSAQARWYL
jgi:ATP-binding cassette subfamily B protein